VVSSEEPTRGVAGRLLSGVPSALESTERDGDFLGRERQQTLVASFEL
jgi:hypothetical protein